MKNPSDPSLMGSAISYMPLGPISYSRIHPNIHILNAMNIIEQTSELNAIKFEVELEMKSANTRIDPGPAATIPILIGPIAAPYKPLYLAKIKSAQ